MSRHNIEATLEDDAPAAVEPSAEQVIDYLRRNPDFLTRPDVMETLAPADRWSENGNDVIDMQHFMLARLREDIDNLRNCAQDLIDTSRTNMSSQTHTHAAVLTLLGAVDLGHFLRVISDDLPLLLDVDAVVIGFEPPDRPSPELSSPHIRELPPGAVDHLLGAGHDVILLPTLADNGTLFGSASDLVRSAGLARLHSDLRTPVGLIALGSRANAFFPGQGTELLCFLAQMVERCIHRWLAKDA